MPVIELRLFGPGLIRQGGRMLRPHSARAFGLLVFLALEPGRVHGRERLAGLLWGTFPEASARQGLRQALYSLRKLGEGGLRESLKVDADTVVFEPDDSVDIDVLRFLEALRDADPPRWGQAAELAEAPLLEGSALDDCEAFGTWLAATRERLTVLALRNLDRLVLDSVLVHDLDAALLHAERLCRLAPESGSVATRLHALFAAGREPRAVVDDWLSLRGRLVPDLTFGPLPEPRSQVLAAFPGFGGDPLDPSALIGAAQAAARVHAFGLAADLYDRTLAVLGIRDPAGSARTFDVLIMKETVLERLGRRTEQAAAIRRALALARDLGDELRIATALLREAGMRAYLGHFEAAHEAASCALEIHRRLDDRPGQAEALRELGFVLWRQADYPAALGCTRDALDLHRRLGDVTGEASALHNLAEILRDLGSPKQALDLFAQALQLHWAARSREGEIVTLFGMARASRQAGDFEGAARRYREALELGELHGLRTMQSRALHALAMHHAARRELQDALLLIRRAIEIDRTIGYAHGLGHDLVDLARIHLDRGERTDARAVLREALLWFGFTEDREGVASTRAWIADLDSGRVPAIPEADACAGVKSHLPLGEGKVYCAFESALGGRRGTVFPARTVSELGGYGPARAGSAEKLRMTSPWTPETWISPPSS